MVVSKKVRVLALVAVLSVGFGGAQALGAFAGSPKVPTTRAGRLAQLVGDLAKHAGPRAAATMARRGSGISARAAATTTVACGQTITASVTLQADLLCSGDGIGLTITAPSVVLNLNGHTIVSTGSSGVGILVEANKVTVQNGTVFGFGYDVSVFGSETGGADQVKLTKLEVGYADSGIYNAGSRLQVTSVTTASNRSNGMSDAGRQSVIKSSRFLNNGRFGYEGSDGQLTGNVANGNGYPNGGFGFLLQSPSLNQVNPTLTGNTANYNNGLGFSSALPLVDNGKNLAKGNANPAQCEGVVCG